MRLKTIGKILMGLAGLYIGEPKKKDWRQPEQNQPGFGDTGCP